MAASIMKAFNSQTSLNTDEQAFLVEGHFVLVKILQARNVCNKDSKEIGELKCSVQVGHKSNVAETKAAKGNSLRWEHALTIPLQPGAFYIRIAIIDVNSNETVGQLQLPLCALTADPVNKWYPVLTTYATFDIKIGAALSDKCIYPSSRWQDELATFVTPTLSLCTGTPGSCSNASDGGRSGGGELYTVNFPGDKEIVEMRVDNVIHVTGSGMQKKGFLFLTNFRLIFVPYTYFHKVMSDKADEQGQTPRTSQTEGGEEASPQRFENSPLYHTESPIFVALGAILSLDPEIGEKKAKGFKVVCSDFRNVLLFFPKVHIQKNQKKGKERQSPAEEFQTHINYVSAMSHNYLSKRTCENIEAPPIDKYSEWDTPIHYGWDFELEEEFKRQNIPADKFRSSQLNQHYQLCPTYPKTLYFPVTATDDMIKGAASFRSKARVPALTYYHATTGSAIFRSSQPSPGLSDKVSVHDEHLIDHFRQCSSNKSLLLIVDCRSKIAAQGNKMKGKGTEQIGRYTNCRQTFLEIDNIHAMRHSVDELRELCVKPCDAWFGRLERTGWLDYLRGIIIGAAKAAMYVMMKKASVLVHCSDGWDRTSQICGMAQIFLDKYYRTFKGFRALVEKDFLSFGHKFNDRLGHKSPRERSPIFIQFLDCVYQVLVQQPHCFEFNSDYLVEFASYFNCGWFGTFLLNSELERKKASLNESTLSIWALLDAGQLRGFRNPQYRPDVAAIWPQMDIKAFTIWKDMYLRYDPSFKGGWEDALMELQAHEHETEDGVGLPMSGYLTKRGARMKTWRRRYFTLSSGRLRYYKSGKHLKTVLGNINVRNARLLVFTEPKDKHSYTPILLNMPEREEASLFGLQPVDQKRIYILLAKNKDERKLWTDALRQHGAKSPEKRNSYEMEESKERITVFYDGDQGDSDESDAQGISQAWSTHADQDERLSDEEPAALKPVSVRVASKAFEGLPVVMKSAPAWEDDKGTQECTMCETKFTVVVRRHHCRLCGKIFCKQCASMKVMVPSIASTPVRACIDCYREEAAGMFQGTGYASQGILRYASDASASDNERYGGVGPD